MTKWNPYERHMCHDCGVIEGEIHKPGCDMERCPFCRGQLITCECVYSLLGIDCLPGSLVYNNGLTSEQEAEWDGMLKKKGLVPYFQEVNLCTRCGKTWPDMFRWDDWNEVIPVQYRDEMLCLPCAEFIRTITTEHLAAIVQTTEE